MAGGNGAPPGRGPPSLGNGRFARPNRAPVFAHDEDEDEHDRVPMGGRRSAGAPTSAPLIMAVAVVVLVVVVATVLLARSNTSSAASGQSLLLDASGPSDLAALRERTNTVFNALTGNSSRALGLFDEVQERVMGSGANSLASLGQAVDTLSAQAKPLIGMAYRTDLWDSSVPLYFANVSDILPMMPARDEKGVGSLVLFAGFKLTAFRERSFSGNSREYVLTNGDGTPAKFIDLRKSNNDGGIGGDMKSYKVTYVG